MLKFEMYQQIGITVCTLVQNCCKGDSSCQWKTPIFTLPGIKNPEPIDIKLDRHDYVGDLTPHANFGISIPKGGGAASVSYTHLTLPTIYSV